MNYTPCCHPGVAPCLTWFPGSRRFITGLGVWPFFPVPDLLVNCYLLSGYPFTPLESV